MSLVRLYGYRDKVLIPTVAQAEEGFYMDVEPVTVCDTADEKTVRDNLKAAFATSNVVVPTPERSDEPGSPILEKLHLRKWLKFEAEAVMYSVHVNPATIEYYATGNAVDGTWRASAARHITFASEDGLDQVIDILLQELRNDMEARNAAPEQRSGGLTLLPPPHES